MERMDGIDQYLQHRAQTEDVAAPTNAKKRLCAQCGYPLCIYNTRDRCWHHGHGARDTVDSPVPTEAKFPPASLATADRRAQQILKAVGVVCDVPTEGIIGRTKIRDAVRARHLTMYLLATELGWEPDKIARAFGHPDTLTARYGLRRMQDHLREPFIREVLADIRANLAPG